MRHARPGLLELVTTLEDSALSFLRSRSDAQSAKPRTVLVLVLVVNQLGSLFNEEGSVRGLSDFRNLHARATHCKKNQISIFDFSIFQFFKKIEKVFEIKKLMKT